jgi:hypothetical protein
LPSSSVRRLTFPSRRHSLTGDNQLSKNAWVVVVKMPESFVIRGGNGNELVLKQEGAYLGGDIYVGERQLVNLFWLVQGVWKLSTYLTYLDCRKQAGYGVSNLWNLLRTSFDVSYLWMCLLVSRFNNVY